MEDEMTGVSRRELLWGFGTLPALPGAKAKEWGTGQLLSWAGGEGLYKLDADETIRVLLLQHPWTIPVIPASLRKGARVVLDCAVGRPMQEIMGYKPSVHEFGCGGHGYWVGGEGTDIGVVVGSGWLNRAAR
jgi:hypothetical protein